MPVNLPVNPDCLSEGSKWLYNAVAVSTIIIFRKTSFPGLSKIISMVVSILSTLIRASLIEFHKSNDTMNMDFDLWLERYQ
ncbi:MAG: hypothetical protein EPN37_10535 [Chitinophagaceae bacterium]|nr:MAG: hypothetical protein EPN37_10535 [Chitinophagaceae bacterium]